MSDSWRIILVAALAAWLGALVLGMLCLRLLFARLGREHAWPLARLLAPLLDLAGMWAGTAAVIALALGRGAYRWGWAACLGFVALMITASLYDRAVLMPSLEAALKRIGHGEQPERWEREWRFLWRMAHLGRALTVLMALAALFFAWAL